MSDFSDQVAIVTGGAQGIGRAVADRLAGGGARLAIWDLDADLAAQAARDIGNGAFARCRAASASSRVCSSSTLVSTQLRRTIGVGDLADAGAFIRARRAAAAARAGGAVVAQSTNWSDSYNSKGAQV